MVFRYYTVYIWTPKSFASAQKILRLHKGMSFKLNIFIIGWQKFRCSLMPTKIRFASLILVTDLSWGRFTMGPTLQWQACGFDSSHSLNWFWDIHIFYHTVLCFDIYICVILYNKLYFLTGFCYEWINSFFSVQKYWVNQRKHFVCI